MGTPRSRAFERAFVLILEFSNFVLFLCNGMLLVLWCYIYFFFEFFLFHQIFKYAPVLQVPA